MRCGLQARATIQAVRLSRIITLAVLGAAAIALVVVVILVVRPSTAGGSFETWAMFADGSRLPVGSRVMVAGVHVGEIDRLGVQGRLARIEMRLADDIVLWDDAWAEKKAESLFGDGYVEIHPGGPGPGRRRLRSGEPIPRVVEEASPDRTLRTLDQSLPRVQQALGATDEFVDEMHHRVAGSGRKRLARAQDAVADIDVPGRLDRARDVLARVEAWTEDAATRTAGVDRTVDRALARAEDRLDALSADLRGAGDQLRDATAEARTRLDDVDPYLERAAAVVAELERDHPIGRLIDDPEPGDRIHDAAEAGSDFTRGLSGLKTVVGLRAEYGILAGQTRIYVGVEVAGRVDSFYVFEVEKEAGDPEATLTDQPGDDRFIRTAMIREKLRLTAQWGRRLGWASLRFGLKEGSFGVGANARTMRGRLKLSVDLFGVSFTRAPRLKLLAAVKVYESVFVVAGVDDALYPHGEIEVIAGAGPVPRQLRELHYGRDYFAGAMLSFVDDDLDKLLILYGALVFGLL
jgi:virulence factor Mce-like protein